MATKLVKDYHKATVSSICVLKIDLMKAFDSVDWKFLLKVMMAMNISLNFIKLVEACVTTPMLSVAFNGGLCSYFPAGKGLRRGDPLSPYLFTIAMEVFSCMLARYVSQDCIPYHPRCKGLGITHLCFADDLLVFSNGSIRAVAGIKRLLDRFYHVSGLKCNMAKC
ncbi:unnamed protein product [Linum trigynum]|uniref:Reverse transcriptase domain-containing protein n=1 Tax=Linum trigynum TaxID=586398 RepID=A0AAV2DV43_9ROSI